MGVISDTSLPVATLDSVGIRIISVILSSDEAGMMKPDPRIYRMALERGRYRGRTLFVDDTPEEADGARNWHDGLSPDRNRPRYRPAGRSAAWLACWIILISCC